MTESVPCLLRVGENAKKYKVFKLDRNQVTIGRSGDVTYAILSNMISRCHAVIDMQEDGKWNITDKKSLNGIYVNGRQLTPFKPYTMEEGDLIQFGVPIAPDTPAEFVYKFYSALKVRIEKKVNKRMKIESALDKDTLEVSDAQESDSEKDLVHKMPLAGKENASDSTTNNLRKEVEKSQKEQAEYQARLEEMEKLLKEKEKQQLEVQLLLEKERQAKEDQAKEVEELRQKEQAILLKMQDKQEELAKEKEELKRKMQEEMEVNLRERENTLKAQLSAQRLALMEEKKQVENNLQMEIEKALEEKNKELEEQLREEKQKLEKIIEKKEVEQKMLESQLNETREESATAKVKALKAREEILSNFVDLMEMELQCAICNELFIKATSLNCSHVFCKLCINQWMKVKRECPNCRKAITSQMQAIALDSYIDRMVEELNDDLKQRRKEVLEIRKADQAKFDNMVAGPSAVSSSSTSSVRGRGGSRSSGSGVRTRGGRVAAAASSSTSRQVTVSSSASSVTPTTVATTTISAATPSVTRAMTAAGTVTALSSVPHVNPRSSTTDDVQAANSNIIELSSDREEEDEEEEDSEDRYLRRRRRRHSSSFSDDSAQRMASDDENESSTDSNSVEGDPTAYYGGYGRCYNCGMRGHWANGCPN